VRQARPGAGERMTPDPDLVVEALRKLSLMEEVASDKGGPPLYVAAAVAIVKGILPHAEAIAEIWDENFTVGVEFFAREPAVQELIAALREVVEGYEAPEPSDFDWTGWYFRATSALAALDPESVPS
jgi:hypothetical protein